MSAINRFVDHLISEYFRDSDSAEKYYGSWIDHACQSLSYEELGQLLSDLLPLLEEETFNISDTLDGQNAFEQFVATLIEQIFRSQGIIVDSGNLADKPFIHVGKLKSLPHKLCAAA